MKKIFWLGVCAFWGMAALAQSKKPVTREEDNTLLWRITGKGMQKPSYLFGTMHLLCADDIQLSDSLSKAIESASSVYLELDMDNLVEMMGAMTKMNMRNDTTLADLLTKEEYDKVKAYMTANSKMLPFSTVEKFKPFLAASMLMEQQAACSNMISMEQLIMEKSKSTGVPIKGMETMAYQMSIFDSIPYTFQAKELVKMISEKKKGGGDQLKVLTDAYRKQQLSRMEALTRDGDMGIMNYTDLLLYKRNRNWASKLEGMLGEETLVIAVGAGHLPGDKGVISLLRKAGYKVEPMKNNMIKKKVKEI